MAFFRDNYSESLDSDVLCFICVYACIHYHLITVYIFHPVIKDYNAYFIVVHVQKIIKRQNFKTYNSGYYSHVVYEFKKKNPQ